MTLGQLLTTLNRLYPSSLWPKPFNLLQAKQMVEAGENLPFAASEIATSSKKLREFLAASDPVSFLLPNSNSDEAAKKDARQILGNLIAGRCAEITFEEMYKQHMHTTELELVDMREGRSDTDYRLYDGRRRPVYRINIKFHGSLFRRAPELVNLEPTDCFALATYKIHGALQKQVNDELPYIFLIVGVPGLASESIGAGVPPELVDFVAHVTTTRGLPRKRDIEDRIVRVLMEEGHPAFATTRAQIADARWFVLGARKAARLLHDKLFERVFALRTRNFSRQFRGAELDMHFSLSHDLTPLSTFLDVLRDDGDQRITTLLERGQY